MAIVRAGRMLDGPRYFVVIARSLIVVQKSKQYDPDAAVTGNSEAGNGGPPLISSSTFRDINFPRVFAAKHAETLENVCAMFLFWFIMQGHQRRNHPSPAAGR